MLIPASPVDLTNIDIKLDGPANFSVFILLIDSLNMDFSINIGTLITIYLIHAFHISHKLYVQKLLMIAFIFRHFPYLHHCL